MSPTPPAISFKNLTVGYGQQSILTDISGGIASGKFTAVIGPNGSGKTTFLQTLSGLKKSFLGQLTTLGKDKLQYSSNEFAKTVAWLPATSYNPFSYSVFDIVMLGRFPWHQGFPNKEDVHQVRELLEELNLAPERSLQEMSSGEARRVMVARALSGNAPILALDEPCMNLDLKYSHRIMSMLADRVNTHGTTIIATMHDMALTKQYADHFIAVKDGRIDFLPSQEHLSEEYLSKLFDIY